MSSMPLGLLSFSAGGGASANALTLISTQVLASAAASVTFSSIPSTYTHLQIRYTSRSDTGSTQTPLFMRLNSDTGTNYSRHWLRGDGGLILSNAGSSENYAWIGYTLAASETTSAYTAGVIDILDYKNTNKNTTLRMLHASRGSVSWTQIALNSAAWYNTAAVNTLLFYPSAGNFITGSRFSLYGVS